KPRPLLPRPPRRTTEQHLARRSAFAERQPSSCFCSCWAVAQFSGLEGSRSLTHSRQSSCPAADPWPRRSLDGSPYGFVRTRTPAPHRTPPKSLQRHGRRCYDDPLAACPQRKPGSWTARKFCRLLYDASPNDLVKILTRLDGALG